MRKDLIESPEKTRVEKAAVDAFIDGVTGRTNETHNQDKNRVPGIAFHLGFAYYRGALVPEPHTEIACGCARCRLTSIVLNNSGLHVREERYQLRRRLVAGRKNIDI